MAKNLLGKTRTIDNPYAVWKGIGELGYTEVRLLKTYQTPINESHNAYSRWFVAVKSDHTHGSFDMGDSYIGDVTRGLTIVQADPLFEQQYERTV
jgi:hypothetical protein|tara:strand:+ start:1692 stop:1976 length:285 start_codon:yes stop_codon:yes gene_type:complete